MTAVDDWIADLAAGKYSDADQNLISRVAVAIAALQQIQTGGGFSPQLANTVLAGPAAAGPALPAFRGLVAADIPAILNAFAMAAGQAITPDQIAGIVGTTAANNAAAGRVGEYLSSNIAIGAPSALANGIAGNTTSLLVPAGDWDISFMAGFLNVVPTTATLYTASISLVSAVNDTSLGRLAQFPCNLAANSNAITTPIPNARFSFAAPTTVFAVQTANYSAGNVGGFGNLSARRER